MGDYISELEHQVEHDTMRLRESLRSVLVQYARQLIELDSSIVSVVCTPGLGVIIRTIGGAYVPSLYANDRWDNPQVLRVANGLEDFVDNYGTLIEVIGLSMVQKRS